MLTNKDKDLITGILTHGPDALESAYTKDISENIQKYVDRCIKEKLNYPMPMVDIPTERDWFIPNEYKQIDIRNWLLSKCTSQEQTDRVELELSLFEKQGMTDILNVMIYVVDTLRSQNIVWGVGRGSSVSCYCLYLIGIHKIDSLKYDLPINEFFKEGD
jgi:DNA polymerase III alpha subunit